MLPWQPAQAAPFMSVKILGGGGRGVERGEERERETETEEDIEREEEETR